MKQLVTLSMALALATGCASITPKYSIGPQPEQEPLRAQAARISSLENEKWRLQMEIEQRNRQPASIVKAKSVPSPNATFSLNAFEPVDPVAVYTYQILESLFILA